MIIITVFVREDNISGNKNMAKIVFIVAHPDDVACAVSGTALLLSKNYEVTVLCVSRGERGIPGTGFTETAAIRTAEEEKSIELLGGEVVFLDCIDGEIFADGTLCRKIAGYLRELRPAAIFTLWPLDRHPDHSAVSQAAVRAAALSDFQGEFYYFEEDQGAQTFCFTPDLYINISSVWQEKCAMIRCHASQNRNDRMVKSLQEQNRFRGMECDVQYAEAFRTAWPRAPRRDGLLRRLSEKTFV